MTIVYTPLAPNTPLLGPDTPLLFPDGVASDRVAVGWITRSGGN